MIESQNLEKTEPNLFEVLIHPREETFKSVEKIKGGSNGMLMGKTTVARYKNK